MHLLIWKVTRLVCCVWPFGSTDKKKSTNRSVLDILTIISSTYHMLHCLYFHIICFLRSKNTEYSIYFSYDVKGPLINWHVSPWILEVFHLSTFLHIRLLFFFFLFFSRFSSSSSSSPIKLKSERLDLFCLARYYYFLFFNHISYCSIIYVV